MAGVIDAITGMLVNRRASRSPFAGRYVGWLAVTVERLPHELEADELPRPLAAFPHPIAVDIRPAPGAKGSELRARLLSEPVDGARGRVSGTTPGNSSGEPCAMRNS